jgi:probable phosphoglycerate mutase
MDGSELLIARHGEAWCNRDQIIAGTATCRGLTPLGRHQAERLASHLALDSRSGPAGRPIDAVYTSPIPRALQTAAIIADTLNLSATVGPDLREPDYGDADGLAWSDVVEGFHARHGSVPALHPDRPIATDAEPWKAHQRRVHAVLTALLDRHAGQRLLLVGHGDTIIAAHHHFLGVDSASPQPLGYLCDYAGLTIWQRQPLSCSRPDAGRRWVLTAHNDTSHLADPPPVSVLGVDR